MTIEFDDKGKFYTDVIPKTELPAIIQTATHCIHGNIHVRRDDRFKDEMDRDEKFLAVTEATIYSMDNQVFYKCDFLSIQRAHIIWAFPEDELKESHSEPGEQ